MDDMIVTGRSTTCMTASIAVSCCVWQLPRSAKNWQEEALYRHRPHPLPAARC
ncbi:MAG: hypothetical protein MZV63_58615 [Marinilabiliales bacterium]|nr:hypothetical protein [Marinilabiliales bacterium]